jgi:hypothetical protein
MAQRGDVGYIPQHAFLRAVLLLLLRLFPASGGKSRPSRVATQRIDPNRQAASPGGFFLPGQAGNTARSAPWMEQQRCDT